jgi:type II secretory pathway component PulJ
MIGPLFRLIAGSRWARTATISAATAGAILLFLTNLRRAGERTGRLAERLDTMERTNAIQRRMLEAAADRPLDRADLAQRLRDVRF